MEQWLVSFDTDRIKDYIFATDKLRELRGASQLLNDLNHELTWETIQTICPESIKIYFAGGSGALLVPSEDYRSRRKSLPAKNLLSIHHWHMYSAISCYGNEWFWPKDANCCS
jgi:hypothetical protein